MSLIQNGHLRRVAVLLVEVFLVTTLVVIILSAAGNGGRSPASILTFGNGSLTRLASSGEVNITDAASLPCVNITTRASSEAKYADLARILEKVATDDRTVIITSVNEPWAKPNSLLDLFRESFRAGEQIEHLLNHTLVVAVDAAALHHCKAVHPYCYLLEVKGFNLSSENNFMTRGYLELVWCKLALQQRVLELGYNFLFTDVDVIWFRNPFRHISVFADMTTSSDMFFGDRDSLENLPNTGFYYVKSTGRTVLMLQHWQAARARFPPRHEQDIFNNIKHELAGQLQVKIQFLDRARFGGFCGHGKNLSEVCTMHANCCVGLENKLHDLRNALADWKQYAAMAPEEKKAKGNFTWRALVKCGIRA